jgi:uncharacterized protein (TIGR02145 family)
MINKHSTNPENPQILRIGVQTILAATLALAITFTLSCSSGGGGGDPTCGGRLYDTGKYGCVNNELVGTCGGIYYNPKYERCLNGEIQNGAEGGGGEPVKSSSSKPQVAVSSSSSVRSSGPSVSYEGETYQTVVIGTQTWMARNLNYAVSGSKCYDNDPANCQKYGRLYDWATAMALPSNCNESSCSSQINAKHRGICPSGWHIPSTAEWTTLENFVGGSSTAGTKLKATSGWYNNGNGTDEFGFSALPGGLGLSDGGFSDVGNYGRWWSASEGISLNAYNRLMYYPSECAGYCNYRESDLYSVRCLKDEGEPAKSSSSQPQVAVSSSSSARSSSSVAISSSSTPPSSSSVAPSSSSAFPSSSSVAVPSSSSVSTQTGVVYGPSVSYEGETYQTVVIGAQTWMARNLNYAADSSVCYNNEPANCATYGRLYDWVTAMALPDSCVSSECPLLINAKHRGICPSGWHIPSNAEWSTLISYVGSNAGTKLKATSGWNSYSGVPAAAGTDSYGFAALPGGFGGSDGDFNYVGNFGSWWNATENGAYYAYIWRMRYDEDVDSYVDYKDYLLSVRCVQD